MADAHMASQNQLSPSPTCCVEEGGQLVMDIPRGDTPMSRIARMGYGAHSCFLWNGNRRRGGTKLMRWRLGAAS